MSETITIYDYARRVGLSHMTVYRRAKAGLLGPVIKVGRGRRLVIAELIARGEFPDDQLPDDCRSLKHELEKKANAERDIVLRHWLELVQVREDKTALAWALMQEMAAVAQGQNPQFSSVMRPIGGGE